jgi:diaminopimelate epimerase
MRRMTRTFLKMNGLGNDFVVVETRNGEPFRPGADEVRKIASRGPGGIGCDQLIAIERSDRADAFMRIWNADGDEVSACGNATRCVGWLLLEATGGGVASIETRAGVLNASPAGPNRVSVDMGPPLLRWDQIPLSEEMDTRGIELQIGPIDAPLLHTPGCVNMGNPHVVFFTPDAESAPVLEMGPIIEHHMLFPEGVNVGFAQVLAPDRIRFRVWERGAGMTRACGTGACAALVACARRKLTGRKAVVVMDGGELEIEWREDDDHVIMTGDVTVEFTGRLP